VDPVPDPLLLRKSGSAGNRTRTSGSAARNWDLDHIPTSSRPTPLPVQSAPTALSPPMKRPEREAVHSPTSGGAVRLHGVLLN
jgi:hypothetical protein